MRKKNKLGFTIIELLMVIMLVAILGAVALPQFLDFRNEGRAAAAIQLSNSISTGVKLQMAQAILRCDAPANVFPPADSVAANDITAGASPLCTTTQIPNASERRFVDTNNFPINPYNGLTTLSDCQNGAYFGWCYSDETGRVTVSLVTDPDAATCSECNQSYVGSGSASFTCDGSGCVQSCTGSGMNCTLACPDGYCVQSCIGSSATCNISCDGGNCSQDCFGAGATCNVTCTGNNCTVI